MTTTLEFQTKHEPGTPEHLHQIAKNWLEGKGVTLLDYKIKI